jgi:hypothetical protein
MTIIYLDAESKLDLLIMLKEATNFDMAFQGSVWLIFSGPVPLNYYNFNVPNYKKTVGQ